MCGSIGNVIDSPDAQAAYALAMIRTGASFEDIKKACKLVFNIRPTGRLPTIIQKHPAQKEIQVDATWWLKLKLEQDEFKPDNQYNSFCCRSQKILSSPTHKMAPASFRSIVIAEGFHEWQPIFKGNRLYSDLTETEKKQLPDIVARQCFFVRPASGYPVLLAALTKQWQSQQYSTGIITLPPHPAFIDIHYKSFPLVLLPNELDSWLNPQNPTDNFRHLFDLNKLRYDWLAIPVQGPSENEMMGKPVRMSENLTLF